MTETGWIVLEVAGILGLWILWVAVFLRWLG